VSSNASIASGDASSNPASELSINWITPTS
jgi:hypothetical protein